MGHGACVLGKLHRAQHAHVFDPFDSAGALHTGHVLAELLVAEDRQALFERELEPVLAGDAVAGPVVEVLVSHDGFDVAIVHIGGGGGVGQHKLGVEDVQTLVFHRAHVEVAGGDDHEAFQVQRQAKAGFVPGHAGHERVHGVFGFVQVAGAHKHLQQVVGAAAAGDALLTRDQLTGHQGEQVAGLFVRIDPLGKVASIVQFTLLDQVAVGQQHRVFGLVSTQRDGVAGHHIWPVQEIGDATKALGLALGEERALAHVQTHELGVLLGVAGGEDFQIEGRGAFGQVFEHQHVAIHLEGGACAIDQHTGQVQVFAVQTQGLGRHVGVAAQAHLVEHPGFAGVEVEGQIDRVDPVRRGGVVFAANGRGLSFTHGQRPCLSDASMNASKSPSSTFWVAEISTLVRRSLMRLLSST